ncbi:glycosyltransferase family 4 protein [Halomarina rubra]|uniref:Glycosyltransferase family 4 protein n=1 Tax=Halomarina rubra TaxID=2071873 RepID=A0ABD6B0Z6_9EURY|nr:glycosyltransferase family 4 protein [Halomarina rubra]
MDPEDAHVVMLCTDPHPAHAGFARAVGAEQVGFRDRSAGPLSGGLAEDALNAFTYPDADVYLVEGSQPLYAATLARARTGAKVVYLCADHGLYDLGRGSFAGQSGLKTLVGRFGRPAVRAVARRSIDGCVAVSGFAAEFVRPFVGDAPVRVAHPYVQPERYEALLALDDAGEDDVNGPTALTVGRGAPYKGVDLLVGAWPQVRASHPDATLHVAGAGHPDAYADVPGVVVHGFVDDARLVELFAASSLFVQPSRMDTFPVSTLEALCAGCLPLVTETAGTRSEARALDPALVVEPTSEALATGVSRFFDRPRAERETLTAQARERGRSFDATTRRAAFRRAFEAVVERL